MRRSHLIWLVLAAALALAAAGCGAGGAKNGEKGAEITCAGSALTGDTGLPPKFPMWDEVTLIVNGWFDGDLKSAHQEYKDRFEAAGYLVLFDELEDKDSEVSYKDAQGKTSGQVALKAECDNGHISVHITNRAS
jgi:ABC-type glycerol-3-phosphate transport system substrate-binding protein